MIRVVGGLSSLVGNCTDGCWNCHTLSCAIYALSPRPLLQKVNRKERKDVPQRSQRKPGRSSCTRVIKKVGCKITLETYPGLLLRAFAAGRPSKTIHRSPTVDRRSTPTTEDA